MKEDQYAELLKTVQQVHGTDNRAGLRVEEPQPKFEVARLSAALKDSESQIQSLMGTLKDEGALVLKTNELQNPKRQESDIETRIHETAKLQRQQEKDSMKLAVQDAQDALHQLQSSLETVRKENVGLQKRLAEEKALVPRLRAALKQKRPAEKDRETRMQTFKQENEALKTVMQEGNILIRTLQRHLAEFQIQNDKL
jgi:chromosome segregation ATPase